MFRKISRRAWAVISLTTAPASLLLLALLSPDARDRVWGRVAGRSDRPEIWVDPPRHDFGRVKPLAELDASFSVSNHGLRTLELQQPTATCGCQKPTIDRLVLRPGEEATLRVHQAAREAVGHVRQMVLLKSNDPIVPEVAIPMDLVVTKGVIVRPEPVYLGQVLAGHSLTRCVEVVSDDGVPFKVTHCATGGSRLDVEAELRIARVFHRVNVTFRAGNQLGPFEERLVVAVDRPGAIPLVIPVRGEVRGPFAVAPSKLFLGSVAGRSETETNLVITGPSGRTRVDEVKISPDIWDVRHDAVNNGEARAVRLHLMIRVPNSDGVLDSELRLHVSVGGERPVVLKVPIVASVHPMATMKNP